MRMIIKGGMIVDGTDKECKPADLLIQDGYIVKSALVIEEDADQVVDATGCFVMPGFIDLHVHLRDPGFTHKEDLMTGARAAARGGVTTICAMPNTKPVVDTVDTIRDIYDRAKEAPVHILQISAITKGQDGKELVDMAAMKEAGAIGFSEDGKSVMDISLYQEAMREAARLNMPVFAHCEDKDLVGKGVLNEGVASEKFGVPGISNAVEDIITARDIFLARETKARLHLCHCSTESSVRLMKMAKDMGLPVTAEVCPHHFILTDEDIVEEDANYKMNPPLRTRRDVKMLKEGLRVGTMECISTDHAPHHADEKAGGFMDAPFGIVGLETSASLTYTELVDTGILSIQQMAQKMSTNPAKVLGIDDIKGYVQIGKIADLVIFDPEEEYVVDGNEFASKGHNTPFAKRTVKGRVKATIVEGRLVYEDTYRKQKTEKEEENLFS